VTRCSRWLQPADRSWSGPSCSVFREPT